MRSTVIAIFLLLFLTSCKKQEIFLIPEKNDDVLTITFGSCSDEDKEQELWDEIISESPDLWVWLGDNIYGDTEDMSVMRSKYNMQLANEGYKKLMDYCPIIGTWDDHDYGLNNGGKEFAQKAGSQKELLDFLQVAEDDPRRSREGVYTSYLIEDSIANVLVILLDNRYFRDEVRYKDKIAQPNYEGTIMGEVQWEWLETVLNESEADVHIIASGIQVIPEQHRFEKWANFPNEQERLYELIVDQQVKRPIFISGDRHIGEISAREWNGYPLYDITSSSLTHGWLNRRPEENKFRVGDIVYDINYGVIEITKKEQIEVTAMIKTEEGLTSEALKLYD